MNKKYIFILTISSIMLILSFVTITFAWFSIVEKTQNILIYSGTIKLDAKLKNSNDVEINNIILDNVVPGDEFTYTLEVTNIGNILGDLEVDFTFAYSRELINNNITFTITSITKSIEEDSIEINNNVVSSLLDENETIIITFKLKVDTSLTESQTGDYFSISKISISLSQSEENLYD